jgi:hypothetical protein
LQPVVVWLLDLRCCQKYANPVPDNIKQKKNRRDNARTFKDGALPVQ